MPKLENSWIGNGRAGRPYTENLRIGWITDIHLNFVSRGGRARFYAALQRDSFDALLLGGDIGEADSTPGFLVELSDALRIPVYFVLGNHDFYRGSIAAVRTEIAQIARESQWLHWLSDTGVVPLTPETALVGHDSWADGRLGNFAQSSVELADYTMIAELRHSTKSELLATLHALGDEAADYLELRVQEAVSGFRNIVVLTHVPPFRAATWHEGRVSDENYLPHFGCRVVGERLAAIMQKHPEARMTVLCGHTHSPGTAAVLPNLTVLTGEAVYGDPQLQLAVIDKFVW